MLKLAQKKSNYYNISLSSTMEGNAETIRRNYDEKATTGENRLGRQAKQTFDLVAFNNWIKAVLIQTQTKHMCNQIQRQLDLPRNTDSKLLHVLDIGCGRGQDISKWRLARVRYMVAVDFSDQCVKKYEQRWRDAHQPYKLYTLVEDFTSRDLYYRIEHSNYDIVSAQFCFHYMFGTQQGLKQGLASILSNLLIGGAFIATIPDSYTILKKVNQLGKVQEDGSKVYRNKYFSLKFKNTVFETPYGNEYGFYLENAVGKKNEDGSIQYTNQWLIELDNLGQILLKQHGVQIQETMNFLHYYNKHKQQFKELFPKFKLNFAVGESMNPQLWQIAHLYRVLICRKKRMGKNITQFGQNKRIEASDRYQLKPTHRPPNNRDRDNNNFSRSRDHRDRSQHHNAHHSNSQNNQRGHQSR